MPIDFPSTPTLGATYTYGTQTYQWDGSTWRLVRTSAVGPTALVRTKRQLEPFH